MKTLNVAGHTYRIDDDDKLLIINNVPAYVVKTAQDVIVAIQVYARESGLLRFRAYSDGPETGPDEWRDLLRLVILDDSSPVSDGPERRRLEALALNVNVSGPKVARCRSSTAPRTCPPSGIC